MSGVLTIEVEPGRYIIPSAVAEIRARAGTTELALTVVYIGGGTSEFYRFDYGDGSLEEREERAVEWARDLAAQIGRAVKP